MHSHLFILYLQRGQAGLQLVVAHQELCLDRLLCTHLTHLVLGKEREGSSGGFNIENSIIQRTETYKQTILTGLLSAVPHLVPHVWLIVKARWRTEDLAVRVHKPELVSSDVHGVDRSLQQVQSFVTRSLQAILCRQIRSQGACQACMIT